MRSAQTNGSCWPFRGLTPMTTLDSSSSTSDTVPIRVLSCTSCRDTYRMRYSDRLSRCYRGVLLTLGDGRRTWTQAALPGGSRSLHTRGCASGAAPVNGSIGSSPALLRGWGRSHTLRQVAMSRARFQPRMTRPGARPQMILHGARACESRPKHRGIRTLKR